MTIETAPAPARRPTPPSARGSSAASSRRARRTSATTSARSATTSRLQAEYDTIYCIVDYHALTSLHDPDALRARTREMAAALVALGLDPDRCILFVQSHRPEHTELAWLLVTVTPVSWLERTPDLQGEEARTSPTTSTTACSRTRSCRPPTSSSTRRRCVPGRQGPGRAPGAVARDRPRASTDLRRDLPRAAGGLHRGAGRARHGRRPEDEQVDRQHHRDPRPTPDVIRRQVMSMVTDTQRILRTDPGPAGGLQRLPAAPLLRRRLRDDLGRRADGADRLRRHQAAARRADHRATTPRPASATRS